MNIFASITPILAAATNVATNTAATAAAAAAAKPATTINAPNGFDAVLAVFLIVGLIRGRKRGMSEELLDVLQWLLIIVIGAMFYKPLGGLLADMAGLAKVYSYMICYAVITVLIKVIFSSIKKAVGEKLMGSDIFGAAEYYLGMGAGMLRYFCMILLVMSFFNCYYISKEEIARQLKAQVKELGSSFFPSMGEIRQMVLEDSFSGPFIHQYLEGELMEPTPYVAPGGAPATPANKQTKAVDDVIGGKK